MKKRTIIFGAGGTAQKVKEKLGSDAEIICYVDNNQDKWGIVIDGVMIYNPSIIEYLFFDQIAIAALKGVNTIKRQLLSLGISEEKITIPIENDRIFFNDKINYEPVYYPEKCKNGVLEKRFDIVLRYCLLKILANGGRHENLQGLCTRVCEDSITGLNLVKFIKIKILPQLRNHKNKINEIKKIAVDDKIWDCNRSFLSCREELSRLNASLKMQLLDAYADLVENCALFVVLGGNKIEEANAYEQIKQLHDPLCQISFDFEDNYIGYFELVKALFNAHTKEDILFIKNEIDISEIENLKVVLFFLTGSDNDFFDKLKDRTDYLNKKKTCFKLLSSCNSKEFLQYKKTILTKTTLDFLSKKHVLSHDDTFFEMLDELKDKMAQYNVPLDKTCITSGSVMRAYGLKKTDDIDIIMTSGFRRLYGEDLVIVSDCVEVHKVNEFDIADDDIINNPQYHFYYYGIKFVSLDILFRQRIKSNSKDARLIELFKNYTDRLGYLVS